MVAFAQPLSRSNSPGIASSGRRPRPRIRKYPYPRFSRARLGMAMFDVTRIVHPHLGLGFGESHEDARWTLRTELEGFDNQYQLMRVFPFGSRILSYSIQLTCPSFITAAPYIGTIFSSLHFPLVPHAGPKAEAFGQVRKALDIQRIAEPWLGTLPRAPWSGHSEVQG